MRVLSVGIGVLLSSAIVLAQAPPPKADAAKAPAKAGAIPSPRSQPPIGTLAQLMRGILFPNSNLIFDVQQNDPAAPKKKAAEGGGASSDFANVYTGWQVVENAAVALGEATDLIMKAGRKCENGKDVPLKNADFQKFAEGLRVAAQKSLAAALTKNQEKVSDSANDLADACANCHEVYRDKGDAKSPLRCVAPAAKK
jgi:hypothetical protein